jgi:hypothetical protein
MEIGVVGKPNVGKSTFFNACTLAGAEVASYPFTTVDPNRAIAYVRTSCACSELKVTCTPKNSLCLRGNRFIPVEIIDVAGLVPRAHEGRGLGNKFLDELRRARVLVHVVDASGATDEEGNPGVPGSYNPLDDVRFLEKEIELWFLGIFKRGWEKISRRVQFEGKDFVSYFTMTYSGMGFSEAQVSAAIKEAEVDPKMPKNWSQEDLSAFAGALRKTSKPIIIAANKADVEAAEAKIEAMKKELDNLVVPTSAMAEYVLRNLTKSGVVDYLPGDGEFKVLKAEDLDDRHRKALKIIEKVLLKYGSTGVQRCIDAAVFDVLGRVVVYPVEDEGKFADKEGRVLPDAYLMEPGSTPRELAYKIHTDIGEAFLGALDAKTKKKIKSDKELENGEVIKILTGK